MKSAYELAMERLSKSTPTKKLTPEQKAQLAELDSVYAAKIASRDIFLKGELAKAQAGGDEEAYAQIQKQHASERRALQEELEEKKEKLRQGFAG